MGNFCCSPIDPLVTSRLRCRTEFSWHPTIQRSGGAHKQQRHESAQANNSNNIHNQNNHDNIIININNNKKNCSPFLNWRLFARYSWYSWDEVPCTRICQAMEWHPDRQPPEKREEVAPVRFLVQLHMTGFSIPTMETIKCLPSPDFFGGFSEFIVYSVREVYCFFDWKKWIEIGEWWSPWWEVNHVQRSEWDDPIFKKDSFRHKVYDAWQIIESGAKGMNLI